MTSQQVMEVASKDCRVCNRRRIKCDRRLPACAKCENRGLTCSGYGILLKWDQGVASRGKLKGKSLPIKVKDTSLAGSSSFNEQASKGIQKKWSGEELYATTSSPTLEISTVPRPLHAFQLQRANERRLLHHYDHIVASNMAWADCHENPWRHIIIPLAFESPPLLNAILAFAAKHINAVSSSTSREKTSIMPVSLPERFQQNAVKLLAQEIQEFAKEKNSHGYFDMTRSISQNRSNTILATMLVLCNVETVWPDSSFWQIHLNAAKTVISSSPTWSQRASQDSTLTFLEQELFIASTFASTTNFLNFTVSEDFKLSDAAAKSTNIFMEFLKLLQMVTSLERQVISNPELLANSWVSISGLRKLFEHARSRTVAMNDINSISESLDYLHLSRTVNCFYHAGLIYSFRALLKDDLLDQEVFIEKHTQITSSKFELFHALGLAETNKPTFAQDLVWPLFIAGTEATQKTEQNMVIAKLQQSMSETGFSNCQHALEFLHALWQKRNPDDESTGNLDWIGFARDWTGQGKTFLVF